MMNNEQLEILFWVLMGIAFVAAVLLAVACAWRSFEESRRGPVYLSHWPEAPEERECQRDLWARFQAERKLKRLERCRSELGQRLQVNGAVRRIG